jgi:monooxygenase
VEGSVTVSAPVPLPDHRDIVIVGAGLSGIGAAYRLQTECPARSYALLEARDTMGGTWDLFRYPGVRSDSDMFTLGYEFKPWRAEKSIADGPTILSYIQETAAEFGIEQHIRYSTKVTGADWSTEEARWTLRLETAEGARTMSCDYLYSCAGYYDYDEAHSPEFPGIDSFAGQVVHPQFWPEDLEYAGKRVVIIGSGATAVTLVPAMADEGTHVTMLQRSPTWIGSVPQRDKIADRIRDLLPARLAHRVIRTKNIAQQLALYNFCQTFPNRARKVLTGLNERILEDPAMVAEHFTPSYNPWDQRLCAVPDADLFRSIKRGEAEVVTDHIASFVPEGIRLECGRILEADVVVTATGLKLLPFGGISPSVDGEPVDLSEQFVWQGAMITGVPNFAVCIGYTNASWTLRADLTHRLVCKVLNHLDRHDLAAGVPLPRRPMQERPLLDLSSGYVQRSIDEFPRQGDRGPWRVRQNYALDSLTTMRRGLRGSMEFTSRSAVSRRGRGVAEEPVSA